MAASSTSTRRLRALTLPAVAAAVLACVSACGNAGDRFKEGAALADCGQQIGVAGPSYPVNFVPGGVAEPDAAIELVGSCDVGAQVAVSGPGFTVGAGIHTKDGAYQAVIVTFRGGAPGPTGILTVSQHGRRLGQMTLLSQWVPPSSGPPNFCDPLVTNNVGTLPKDYCPPGWHMGLGRLPECLPKAAPPRGVFSCPQHAGERQSRPERPRL